MCVSAFPLRTALEYSVTPALIFAEQSTVAMSFVDSGAI